METITIDGNLDTEEAFFKTLNFTNECFNLITKGNYTFGDCKKIAKLTINNALQNKVIAFSDTFDKQIKTDLIYTLASDYNEYASQYKYRLMDNMKKKTAKFFKLLDMFSKPNTFSVVRLSDAVNKSPASEKHTYHVKCKIGHIWLHMIVWDIPHQVSNYSLTFMNGKKVKGDYEHIWMHSDDGIENFRNFIYYFEKARDDTLILEGLKDIK